MKSICFFKFSPTFIKIDPNFQSLNAFCDCSSLDPCERLNPFFESTNLKYLNLTIHQMTIEEVIRMCSNKPDGFKIEAVLTENINSE